MMLYNRCAAEGYASQVLRFQLTVCGGKEGHAFAASLESTQAHCGSGAKECRSGAGAVLQVTPQWYRQISSWAYAQGIEIDNQFEETAVLAFSPRAA